MPRVFENAVGNQTGSGNPVTIAYAMTNGASGAGRMLLVTLYNATDGTATYNGNNMAVLRTQGSGTTGARLYAILDADLPADTSSHDIVFSFGGSRTVVVDILEVSGVEQQAIGSINHAGNNGNNVDPHTLGITPNADGADLVLFYGRTENRTMVSEPSDSGATDLYSTDTGTTRDAQRITNATGPTPAALTTYTWDQNSTSTFQAFAVELVEAAASGVSADGALTLPALDVAGTGEVPVQVDAALSLPMLDVAGTADVPITADGALAIPALTLSGAAAVLVTADGALTLPMLTLAGTADIPSGEATGALSLPVFALTGAGVVPVRAAGALTLPSLVVAAQTDVQVQAAVSLVLPALVLSGAARGPGVTASGALTLPSLTLASAGHVVAELRRWITGKVGMRPVVTGSVATRPVVTGQASMRPVVTSKVAMPPIPPVPITGPRATAGLSLPALAVSGAAVVPVQIAAGLTLPALGVSGAAAITNAAGLLDAFNRADNATSMGTSDNGKVWSGAGYGILSNQAYRASGTGFVFATADAGISDGTGEITLAQSASAGNFAYVALRYVDDSNLLMVQIKAAGQVGYRLFRRVAGVFTALSSDVGTVANGDVVGWILNADSVQILQNGSPLITVTESAHQSATRFGIGANASTAGVRFDDISMVP